MFFSSNFRVGLLQIDNNSLLNNQGILSILEEAGYISQPHTSAGRIPTDKGYRLYVNRIHEASETAVPQIDRSARAIEARVQVYADQADRAIRSAVDSLVELTGNLGIATIGDQLYMSGMSNLFSQPEFVANPRNVQQIARLLDNLEPWLYEAAPNEPLNVFIGAENPVGKSSKNIRVEPIAKRQKCRRLQRR